MTLSEDILKAVEIIAKSVQDSNFDHTYTGIVSSVNKDGYTVKYNGMEVNIKSNNTSMYKKYDTVKFCVPSNNKNKAYIVVDIDALLPSSSISFTDNTGKISGTTVEEVLKNIISKIS